MIHYVFLQPTLVLPEVILSTKLNLFLNHMLQDENENGEEKVHLAFGQDYKFKICIKIDVLELHHKTSEL